MSAGGKKGLTDSVWEYIISPGQEQLRCRTLWKSLSEHGSAAFRLFFCGLILNDIPMLDEDSVLNAHNVGGNPIHRSTETAKSPVHDHEVPFGHDRSRFVLQCWRKALDEIEQTFTTGCDMGAVLDVFRRPESFRGCIGALVEEGVERFQDEGLVLFGCSLRHVDSFCA